MRGYRALARSLRARTGDTGLGFIVDRRRRQYSRSGRSSRNHCASSIDREDEEGMQRWRDAVKAISKPRAEHPPERRSNAAGYDPGADLRQRARRRPAGCIEEASGPERSILATYDWPVASLKTKASTRSTAGCFASTADFRPVGAAGAASRQPPRRAGLHRDLDRSRPPRAPPAPRRPDPLLDDRGLAQRKWSGSKVLARTGRGKRGAGDEGCLHRGDGAAQ